MKVAKIKNGRLVRAPVFSHKDFDMELSIYDYRFN